jgi:hypothetical protein
LDTPKENPNKMIVAIDCASQFAGMFTMAKYVPDVDEVLKFLKETSTSRGTPLKFRN